MDSKSGRLRLSQTLHGYRDGHKLLASSLALDEYANIEMARMSDMMPKSLAAEASYLCAYPLKSINRYVLARTWSASEMPRPGCVWTHSILMDYAAVAKLVSLDDILSLLIRPVNEDFSFYHDDLLIGLRGKRNEFGIDDDFKSNKIEKMRSVLIDIYFLRQSKILVSPCLTSSSDEYITISAWNQMPPRLRRDFVFCTAGSLRSLTPPAEVTLIVTDEVPQQISATQNIDDEGLKLLLEDVFSPARTDLRVFVNRYVTDAKDARGAVVSLAKIASLLFVNDTSSGLQAASLAIVEYFGASNDCRMLKREFLLGTLLDERFDKGERLRLVVENVLTAFKDLQNYDDKDAVTKFVQELQFVENAGGQIQQQVAGIIRACRGAIRQSLGFLLIEELCAITPLTELASLPLEAELKLILASFNPALLHDKDYWRSFLNEPELSNWHFLNQLGSLEVITKGFLIGKMYSPFRALLIESPTLFVPALVDFISEQETDERFYLLQIFRPERVAIVEYLASHPTSKLDVLADLIIDIFHSPYPEVSIDCWLDMLSTDPQLIHMLPPHLAYFLFVSANKCRNVEMASRLYRMSFQPLHSLDVSTSVGARAVIEKINVTLPVDYGSGSTDFRSRLRRRLCDYFESTNAFSSFIDCAGNDFNFEKLASTMNSTWRGKDWLRRFLTAIQLKEVLVSAYQGQLISYLVPPPKAKIKKGFFDW